MTCSPLPPTLSRPAFALVKSGVHLPGGTLMSEEISRSAAGPPLTTMSIVRLNPSRPARLAAPTGLGLPGGTPKEYER